MAAGDAGNAWDEGIFPWESLLSWAAGEKSTGYLREALAGAKEFSSLFHKNPWILQDTEIPQAQH